MQTRIFLPNPKKLFFSLSLPPSPTFNEFFGREKTLCPLTENAMIQPYWEICYQNSKKPCQNAECSRNWAQPLVLLALQASSIPRLTGLKPVEHSISLPLCACLISQGMCVFHFLLPPGLLCSFYFCFNFVTIYTS